MCTAHRPATVVEDGDVLWSVCADIACATPLMRRYDSDDEDRLPGWTPWRIAPVVLP